MGWHSVNRAVCSGVYGGLGDEVAMNDLPEHAFVAPLCELPQSALKYAEINSRYVATKKELRFSIRSCGHKSERTKLLQEKCAAIEIELENHSKGIRI